MRFSINRSSRTLTINWLQLRLTRVRSEYVFIFKMNLFFVLIIEYIIWYVKIDLEAMFNYLTLIWPQFQTQWPPLDQFILNLRTFRIHLVSFLICVLVFLIFRTKIFFFSKNSARNFQSRKWVCNFAYIRYVITKVNM